MKVYEAETPIDAFIILQLLSALVTRNPYVLCYPNLNRGIVFLKTKNNSKTILPMHVIFLQQKIALEYYYQ